MPTNVKKALYWINLKSVRNISVRDYEAQDMGTSGKYGDLLLQGVLHIQPKGAVWDAKFPFRFRAELDEDPRSGTIVISIILSEDPVARLVNMAIMDDHVERTIMKMLGKIPYVSRGKEEGLRAATIRLASTFPEGSSERRDLLAVLKESGISYGMDQQWFSWVGNKTPFNIDVQKSIGRIFIPITTDEGRETEVPLRFIRSYHSPPLTYYQEKKGQKREIVFAVSYPEGYQEEVVRAIRNLGRKLKFKVTPLRRRRDPVTQR